MHVDVWELQTMASEHNPIGNWEEQTWWSHTLGLWTASVLAMLLYYVWWSHHPMYGKNKGPKVYPIIGSTVQILWNLPRTFDWTTEDMRNSQTLTVRYVLGSSGTYVTANPENVEHMLKTNFQNYPKGDYMRKNLHNFLGTGILNVDGELWQVQRRIASSEFSTRSLRTFLIDCVQEEITTRLLPILSSACQSGSSLDLQDILKRFNFDNICKLTLGVDPACLDMSLPNLDFEQAFDVGSAVSASRFSNFPFIWKGMRALNIGSERKLREAVTKIRTFVMSEIRERREQMQGDHSNTERFDLLSRFMNAEPQGTEELSKMSAPVGTNHRKVYSDEFLHDMVISFLQAGRDTSAVTLSWFFWLLTCNRRAEDAIRAEMTAILDARSSSKDDASNDGAPGTETPMRSFSFEELKQMHYLHSAITESMRVYAPVPYDPKVAKNADVWPDGTIIPKGTLVAYHPYSMGRMERIWGPDCLEYKPERWLNNDGVFVPESPYKFPVFQAGPRICLGKDMAMIQMKLIAAVVLQQFTFSVPTDFKPVYALTFVLPMKHGLPVFVHRREAVNGS